MYLYEELSKEIISAYYEVYNELGFGFLEKVYENAMILALKKRNLHGNKQVPIKVHFQNNNVGLYFADIVVENKIIIELKAGEGICSEHEAQLTNYLRATEIELGLLFNFGVKPQFRRKIFENKYKKSVPIC